MAGRHQFSGIWRSCYWYPSNTHDGEDVSEYELMAHQRGHKLVLESLPNSIKSHITINLSVEGKLATGSWLESTSPSGEFQGMVYSGALQLLVTEDGRQMEGKWVGVGREKVAADTYIPRIYTGRWQMFRVDQNTVSDHTSAREHTSSREPAAVTRTVGA